MNPLTLLWARAASVLAVVLGLALAGGSVWHRHQMHQAKEQAEALKHQVAAYMSLAAEEARNRAEEAAIHAHQQKALDAATAQLQTARADADASRAALDRLRQRVAATAAAGKASADPATAGPSPAAGSSIDLLADVSGRLGEAARQLADVAEQRRIAGLLCERSYEAVRAALDPDHPHATPASEHSPGTPVNPTIESP